MNIDNTHLCQHVIAPTLHYLEMYSPAALHMLLGVAKQESAGNPFCVDHQGLGLYQISSAQHRSVWDNYLAFQPDLASRVRGLASQHQFLKDPDSELITNLRYSTAIALMIFLQSEADAKKLQTEPLNPYWHKLYHEEIAVEEEAVLAKAV
ncbi:hypothetical protein NO559_01180 [Dasania sp. GY-MA-18]|uniref:Transglycosylase SLT domain-containing protein n=1 Tax=Dasania phycosphaerae TaxID=2950436 RepID=A0A9J6RHV4_9GAMM|nr:MULTISPECIES: hypothetical protein [Dasania]MCR8921363.1 hypothetical protein [Dasania sp. GY-MA-18]MCZ0863791.1 hypothetical protein [Dasania phycosphaerae]MCZ0867519.1 hypothetical protein [Dasania phycosphaerae]